ncbi:hypothetical protein NMY22_g8874 [Coprinellus aureogranulatus]|nr:hypothetical protein NMY22_g8874 [Coprinellus aureogranulatus]
MTLWSEIQVQSQVETTPKLSGALEGSIGGSIFPEDGYVQAEHFGRRGGWWKKALDLAYHDPQYHWRWTGGMAVQFTVFLASALGYPNSIKQEFRVLTSDPRLRPPDARNFSWISGFRRRIPPKSTHSLYRTIDGSHQVVFLQRTRISFTGILASTFKAILPRSIAQRRWVKAVRRGEGEGLKTPQPRVLILVAERTSSAPINRVKSLMPWMVATGDDDAMGSETTRSCETYTQHFDYISDFLWLPDKKQLVSTSGDGTLSVMDIRSKKPEPIAHSEDQEDELLSIVAIKGSTKILVGTQIGVISVFNRNKGWGDCVDRIPGHPLSVDALCNVPAGIDGVDYESTVLTGSSDGYVRAVQILPTKLLGVVADHGEFPVERIAVGEGAEGNSEQDTEEETSHDTKVKPSVDADEDAENEDNLSREKKWWVGSVGHDDVLRLTDLEGFFRESAKDDQELEADDDDEDSDLDDGDLDAEAENQGPSAIVDVQKGDDDEWSDEEDEEEYLTPPVVAKDTRKREVEEEESQDEEDDEDGKAKNKNKKRKLAEKDSIRKSKKGKKEPQVIDKGFFDGL